MASAAIAVHEALAGSGLLRVLRIARDGSRRVTSRSCATSASCASCRASAPAVLCVFGAAQPLPNEVSSMTNVRSPLLLSLALSAVACVGAPDDVSAPAASRASSVASAATLLLESAGQQARVQVPSGPLATTRVAPWYLADGAATQDPLRVLSATRARFDQSGAAVTVRREGRRIVRESGVSASPFAAVSWTSDLGVVTLEGPTPVVMRLPDSLSLEMRRNLLANLVVAGYLPTGTTRNAVTTPLLAASVLAFAVPTWAVAGLVCKAQCATINQRAAMACAEQSKVPSALLDCDAVTGVSTAPGGCGLSLDYTCVEPGGTPPGGGPGGPGGPGPVGPQDIHFAPITCAMCTEWVTQSTQVVVTDKDGNVLSENNDSETLCANVIMAFGADNNGDGWCD